MTWKNIIKAPTRNEDTQYGGGYKGTRTHSEVDDEMMAKIVKDLNLPKMDKDGEEIDYYEEPDVHLIPSLELVGEKYTGEYKLVIKFEGNIAIWAEDADDPSHTFTADDIEFENSSIEFNNKWPVALDYELSQYYDGKIYLDVFEEK